MDLLLTASYADLAQRAFAVGAGWYAAYLMFCIVEGFLIGDDE